VCEYLAKASRLQFATVSGHLSCPAPAGNTAGDIRTNYVNRVVRNILWLLLSLLLLFTAIEFSLGGSSPYASNK
jgi:hypothetical protein